MNPPLSLTGTYQLVILGHQGDLQIPPCASRLDCAVSQAVSHLGVPKKFLTLIPSGASAPAVNRKMPTVGIFFGVTESPTLAPQDVHRLSHMIEDGVLIVPVVKDLTRFSALVPNELSQFNGISFENCGGNFERLAARVLEGFRLLRETRRLFISYRRTETSDVAAQLYEELDAAGFDVFLDTHGILRPGEPFQEILWHRLADTDVAVVLDSPGFLASRWTEEELARANASNIQILQVLWPGQEDVATAAFSTFHPLADEDFKDAQILGRGARLRAESLTSLVDAVESLRARAIAARHSFLVREFVSEARAAGLVVRTTLNRDLVLSGHGGDEILVQPAVGVPDAEGYETLETLYREESKRGRRYGTPNVLLYDQTGLRPRWLTHLQWLNGNLNSVRSISIMDAQAWLHGISKKTLGSKVLI